MPKVTKITKRSLPLKLAMILWLEALKAYSNPTRLHEQQKKEAPDYEKKYIMPNIDSKKPLEPQANELGQKYIPACQHDDWKEYCKPYFNERMYERHNALPSGLHCTLGMIIALEEDEPFEQVYNYWLREGDNYAEMILSRVLEFSTKYNDFFIYVMERERQKCRLGCRPAPEYNEELMMNYQKHFSKDFFETMMAKKAGKNTPTKK